MSNKNRKPKWSKPSNFRLPMKRKDIPIRADPASENWNSFSYLEEKKRETVNLAKKNGYSPNKMEI